ncbi:hypothetical protein [Pseudogemmobacter bohemicus]|uniref:hypothetical protein n=1 Tax=Pseudogemmobacter bohemicus TaxID=2250708 RepID=UPI000DD4B51B|nr:hypothetical protein [Pseudogemmobacter bohemicus]
MRRMMSTALALAIAPPALAREPLGCFARDYSAAHLGKNPNQHVAALRLNFRRSPDTDYLLVDVIGRFADQGRARREGPGGAYFTQGAFCNEQKDGILCMVECDGGTFLIRSFTGDQLEISTDYFALRNGEGCEAISDLAETDGRKTTCRLARADAATCRGVD